MVLVFVKQNDADARPRALNVEAGQIINLAELDALTVDKPSAKDLEKGMTKPQMLSIVHGLGMRITNEGKAKKEVIADLLLKGWDSKIMPKVNAKSSSSAPTSSGSGEGYAPQTNDATDAPSGGSFVEIFSSKDFRETKEKMGTEGATWTEEDEGIYNLLKSMNPTPTGICVNADQWMDIKAKRERCLGLGTQVEAKEMTESEKSDSEETDGEKTDDEQTDTMAWLLGMTPEHFKFYVQDGSDFFANPKEIAVFSGKGSGRHLFNITIDLSVTTVETAKEEVMRHIDFFAKDSNHATIAIDDFALSDGHNLLKNTNVVSSGVCALYMVVRLRGGALGVKRLEKTKAKVAETSKAFQASSGKVGVDLKAVPLVQKIEKVLDDFSKSIANVGGQKALTKQMKVLCQTSPDVAREILTYLTTSQSGSAEVKMRSFAEKFLGCDGIAQKIEELNAVSESVKLAVIGAFHQSIVENADKKRDYTITSFHSALDMVLNMRDDGDDAML
eukprot:Skav236598  [mRNA]  locus=scaffold3534:70462:71967:+ [translate_table: standard]